MAAIEPLAGAGAAPQRTFTLGNFQINGRDMDLGRIDEVVPVGATEVWEVANDHGDPHSFHVHDVQFQVLAIDGAPPPPHLAGWKDTIYGESPVSCTTSSRIPSRLSPSRRG